MKIYPRKELYLRGVMKKYWNITVIFILSTFIGLCFLHLSTSALLRSPNLMDIYYLEDLKTIYELDQSLKSVYEVGTEIEDPELRFGGGYEVSINFLNRTKSYYLQGNRIIYTEKINGEQVFLKFVKVNEETLRRISRRVHYIWNQLDESHG